MNEQDQPIPEDEKIRAAFPTRSGSHETYAEAMRMVGAKHSKQALVELVNWLLYERSKLEKRLDASRALTAQRDAWFCELDERIKELKQAIEVFRPLIEAQFINDSIPDSYVLTMMVTMTAREYRVFAKALNDDRH